jgi:CubicO group peptidase (beta-lactamase class C family)
MATRSYTRRAAIAQLLRAAGSTAAGALVAGDLLQAVVSAAGQPGRGLGEYIEPFRQQFRVPAISVAVSTNGRFVYDHAGGMADAQHAMQAQRDSLFRIADLSKPVTAVTIFSLIEDGKLRLTDKVFGPGGVLGNRYGNPPFKQYVADVTVDHLLTHTAGGWAADADDPMLHHNGWDQTRLIADTIANVPLTAPPGTQWIYSNFGYCVLGRVIEQVTGQSYEAYVQTRILAPCGISGMQIAHNSERQRASGEVIYVGQYSEDPYKINVSRMDSTAGWIASSTQLVQFLNHVAGAPGIPALLKPESIRVMTTPAPASPPGNGRYARGWMVSHDGGSLWHNGSLPGSTSMMVRSAGSLCSAALCNTRTQPHQEMDASLSQMMANLAQAVSG